MSQQTTPSTTGVATATPAQRKRKKSPKPKEPKRAAETKRSKVAQRKEQDAGGRGAPQVQPQRQPPSHTTAEDDEVRAPPSSRRRVIDSDPPETPTSNLLSGAGLVQPHAPDGFNPGATADPRLVAQQDPRNISSHLGATQPGQTWVPQAAPPTGPAPADLQKILENHGSQLRELGLYMREMGLLMRELLKHKLGHNAVLPSTPTLDGGTFAAPLPAASSQEANSSNTAETWSAPALGLFSNSPANGLPGAGDRSTLGVGQPPQRLSQQGEPGPQSQGFTNGVAFNIGSIHQPITVAPLSSDTKPDIMNSSPNAPGGMQMPQSQPHQPSQPLQQLASGPSSAETHQTPGTANMPMFRDTSQPQMSDPPQTAFQMPGQQPSIRTPQIPPAHHDGSVTPVSAAPSAASGPAYPGAAFTNQPHPTFHHGHFVRPSPTPLQQQQALQQLAQQQQYQQQLHAQMQMQRQAAIMRQAVPYYAHQQMVGLPQVSPGSRSASATAGRPQRPPYLNTNPNLGGMGEDTETLPAAHTQMSPNPAQLANFQRAQMASYNNMRQAGGQGTAPSPVNQSFAIPHQQYGAMASAAPNTFMGGVGLTISPTVNGAPPNNPAFNTIGATGSGAGGNPQAPPMASTGGTDMATPSLYMYAAAEPSPFSANFPSVPAEESPFSFNPPETGQDRNWGDDDDDDEEGLQDSPGRFNG